MFKIVVSASFAVVLLFSMTGCNTVKGVGEDVKVGGQSITHGAEKVSDAL